MTTWLDETVDQLANQPCCGYYPDQTAASEPTALTAIVLLRAGRIDAARRALAWLVRRQNADGSVGVTADLATPGWPSGLAVLAWTEWTWAKGGRSEDSPYREPIERAVGWILRARGETLSLPGIYGHDGTLIGWPWVAGTHSWIEPTAIGRLALQAVGHGDHPRAREAERLLVDRFLPDGGCNYGNTRVWGSVLRPQLQPTGLAVLALAHGASCGGGVEKSLDYLQRNISPATPALSLGWALLGLAAHDRAPAHRGTMLVAACRRNRRGGRSPHRSALLSLAALGGRSLGKAWQ